jgi:hypothetical protein
MHHPVVGEVVDDGRLGAGEERLADDVAVAFGDPAAAIAF